MISRIASKVWEIPAKPKPGRKPKKDSSTAEDDGQDGDAKSRRGQNRAAQRAFRERKQTQLAELQTRIQRYEQGEIERNVALQKVAKRLKEENEQLKQENVALKAAVAALEADRKRRSDGDLRLTPAKRVRTLATSDPHLTPAQAPSAEFSLPSPLSTAPSPPEPEQSCSPAPQEHASSPSRSSSYDGFFDLSPTKARPNSLSAYPGVPRVGGIRPSTTATTGYGIDQFDCGFCDEQTPCVCREIALQSAQADDPVDDNTVTAPHPLKLEQMDQWIGSSLESIDVPDSVPAIATPSASLLDNIDKLPFQPAVPLRRRVQSTKSAYKIFPVFTLSSSAIGDTIRYPIKEREGCSGDPSNCPACADDTFGRAFCTAIRDTVANAPRCTACPGDCSASSSSATSDYVGGSHQTPATSSHARENSGTACCGDLLHCGRDPAASSWSSSDEPAASSERTIPTDSAWRTLKQHPNAAFADLRLLAEVVARRSKCSGPVVVIDPPAGTGTPDRIASPPRSSLNKTMRREEKDDDGQPVLLTDPHSRSGSERDATPPNCAESPVHCGKRRIREVPYDAVRDAIRLLDASSPNH
ncbi:hypothetical protein PUNSTDRAFT_49011 [Punctularia strigosozonata HHB-11173 SS5]|uniref:uncharacterized protein n=1 Tax=Punctularia strigosozonata (strain HHB-11173) TaxID=741275 RepID=UPI00044166E2|nr:uncharacterized protein PUNSTDRAFT_49011 [Punctularia strigosozonata HHB-11173 SS5]EIN14186.1 hypothetical protein PUNSTDRAFT_49011 [Punctularia strigosozonata HHB-11173 SS5]